MIAPDNPSIEQRYNALLERITAQGVRQWAQDKLPDKPDLEGLVYLCKFSFFTAILTKAEIGRTLEADRAELKGLVKSWYDDHRRKGCGIC